jgi:hypothetical protein
MTAGEIFEWMIQNDATISFQRSVPSVIPVARIRLRVGESAVERFIHEWDLLEAQSTAAALALPRLAVEDMIREFDRRSNP